MTDPFPPQPPAHPGPHGAPPDYAAQAGYTPPPGAYAVPVGGYQAPIGGYAPPPQVAKGSSALGVVSLVLALIAVIVIPILGGVFGAQIGALAPDAFLNPSGGTTELSELSPARTQILWTEITFWVGTAVGVTAIVTGIIAAAKRRGRGMGITGLVLAVLGPVVFLLVFSIAAASGAVGATTL
ncbi:hypothetical protein L2X99_02550 [Microbacterium sp. KUDC0406]|uniref:hypothetical protein n=1 Tax=Microbacterium sp. KUDC0406 TaxID=2909588 RepID=UPI001F353692|nr:hypothetical protein [Microbacterium sp. KUDC0406]UJP10579.1 hypothetical protein L2X99_02550 [Microbacterium sp. KUDC0406]